MFETLIFKTNYNKDPFSGLRDALEKFEVPRDSAFKIFPRRKTWANGIDGSYGIQGGTSNRVWQKGEYDLWEIGRIIDTEAFVQQAVQKKHTLIFKGGFHVKCENKTNERYIKRRMAEIEYVGNFYWSKFVKEIMFNLLTMHNVFILKIRKKNASSGQVRKWKGQGRDLNPISSYFILPAEAMEFKTDEYGTIEKYRQNMNGYFLEYDPKDIIHITFNKRTGFILAAPPFEAVKDDILALRKIEESVESLIYKVLFPIIHVKVGTEKSPAKLLPDGISEVSIATKLLKQIDDMGGIATSERIEVDVIGAESQALRVEAYLKYFKQRVYSGLGMSSLDYGDLEGSGAAAGDYVTSALTTSVFAYQDEVADCLTRTMFDELLLEKGTYEHTFEIDDDARAFFTFSDADIDTIILKENHTINKANADLLTTDEARKELGKPPLENNDPNQLHGVRVAAANEERQHKIAKDLAKHEASLVPPTETTSVTKKATNGASTTTKVTKTGTIKSQPTKKQGSSGAAKAKVKPKNQHSKDWLITKIFQSINNKSADNIIKYIADYILWNGTKGFIDPEEQNSLEIPDINTKAKMFNKEILDGLNNLNKQNITHPVLLNKKRDIVIGSTIDKVEEYVNNIV